MKKFKIPSKKILLTSLLSLVLLFLLIVLAFSLKSSSKISTLPLLVKNILVYKDVDSISPFRLKIPKIKIDAEIEYVGLTPSGAMDSPNGPNNVGWFKRGTIPGDVGSSVVDGHSGWKDNLPAVFDNLNKLIIGDKIYIENGKGAIITFIVRDIKTYKSNADTTEVFNSNDGLAHLNLITCSGAWDELKNSSEDRLVVFTDRE